MDGVQSKDELDFLGRKPVISIVAETSRLRSKWPGRGFERYRLSSAVDVNSAIMLLDYENRTARR